MPSNKLKNIKLAQDTLLALLKVIDELCKRNKIEYWIDGGTLLGAIRKKGFIPWDDDIDLCFLPDDYHRFIAVVKEEITPINSNLFLYGDFRPFPHWSEYLADSRTVKKLNLPYKIDIIKMKSLPNNEESKKIDRSFVNYASFFAKKKFKYDISCNLKDHQNRFIENNIFFKRNNFLKYFNNYVDQLNKKDSSHLYSYSYNDVYIKKEREYYTYNDIFPLREIDFEGISVSCPNNVESYLTKLYGKDFIQPPPIEKQIPASPKISKNKLPIFVTKALIYVIYLLKEIKFELISHLRKK